MPRTAMRSAAWASMRSATAGSPRGTDGLDRADGVHRGSRVVHPDPPDTGPGRKHGRGRRGGATPLGGRGPAVGGGKKPAEEGLARRAKQHGQAEGDEPV